jgi:hypothetical protein
MTTSAETRSLSLQSLGLPSTLSGVDWQCREKAITRNGKEKDVIKGIPTEAFWGAWKFNRDKVREELRLCNASMSRLARGQWEVILWGNKHNRDLIAKIAAFHGWAVEVAPLQESFTDSNNSIEKPF